MTIPVIILPGPRQDIQAQCSGRNVSDLGQLKRLSQLFGRLERTHDMAPPILNILGINVVFSAVHRVSPSVV